MGYVIAGASLSKLVLAHDCSNTDVETLGEAYVERSEEEIAVGLRWFYCCGLGVALLSMSNSYASLNFVLSRFSDSISYSLKSHTY